MDHKNQNNNFAQAVGLWSPGMVYTVIVTTNQPKPWLGSGEKRARIVFRGLRGSRMMFFLCPVLAT